MRTSVFSTRALIARALTAGLFAAVTLFGLSGSPAWSQTPKDIRWGTGPVGSVGHKALVVLADLLNKEMPEYRITVLPMPGAVMTVKGFATEQIDAIYGSDDALREYASDTGRFKGFKATQKRQPVQSMWIFTLDTGLAIKASNADKIKKWGDLTGKKVYTGPLPFDTRLHLENALAALGVKHIYNAGRPVDRRLAAAVRLDRGHDRLLHRRRRAGTVAQPKPRSRSIGRVSIRARTSAPRSRPRASPARTVEASKISKNDIHVQKADAAARSIGASTSA